MLTIPATPPQPGEGNETASDNMTTLRGLIGRADDELVKAFGEGEAVVEDALTTGRRYTMNNRWARTCLCMWLLTKTAMLFQPMPNCPTTMKSAGTKP